MSEFLNVPELMVLLTATPSSGVSWTSRSGSTSASEPSPVGTSAWTALVSTN